MKTVTLELAASRLARSNRLVSTRGLKRLADSTHCAFSALMNATKSRSDLMGMRGGGGAIPSRWYDSRRNVRSTRWATTSRTAHAPAIVGRSQSPAFSPRSSTANSRATGRNIAGVDGMESLQRHWQF